MHSAKQEVSTLFDVISTPGLGPVYTGPDKFLPRDFCRNKNFYGSILRLHGTEELDKFLND